MPVYAETEPQPACDLASVVAVVKELTILKMPSLRDSELTIEELSAPVGIFYETVNGISRRVMLFHVKNGEIPADTLEVIPRQYWHQSWTEIVQKTYHLLDPNRVRPCLLTASLGTAFIPHNPGWYYTVSWTDLKTRTFKVYLMPTSQVHLK
jgi:hypothetical protein